MTIRGDLQASISDKLKPGVDAERVVADTFSFLTSADVLTYLGAEGHNLEDWCAAIGDLRGKCLISPKAAA